MPCFKQLREGSALSEIQSFLPYDREGLTTTRQTCQEATVTIQTGDDKGPHQGPLTWPQPAFNTTISFSGNVLGPMDSHIITPFSEFFFQSNMYVQVLYDVNLLVFFFKPTFFQVILSSPMTWLLSIYDYSEIYLICSEFWTTNTNIQMTT